jgi:hypothetical protein
MVLTVPAVRMRRTQSDAGLNEVDDGH